MEQSPLKFQVAPHIVEDLGLNLYTSLPRVLAEFVANAYDADASHVNIELDFENIRTARAGITEQFREEQEQAKLVKDRVEPLGSRVLPSHLTIVIEDDGHGMSRDDLRTKFLIAGRRRRKEVNEEGQSIHRTPTKQRPLMGRKGLGKLAGFGVAKRVEVLTKKDGDDYGTRICLDYDELIKARNVLEVVIPDERINECVDITGASGTKVTLSSLLHDPLRSRLTTIERELGEHFEFIRPGEFEIRLNGKPMTPIDREHNYAWPQPDRPTSDFVPHALSTEEGPIEFEYRLRFTADRKALPAEKRGVRVYAGPRLASNPSLLDADTNMHGFRMTDYLDGVVKAPFIDLQEVDYIATDRQSLRWDAPLLSPLKEFLSDEIKEACKRYQAFRDARIETIVREDAFTLEEIQRHTDFSAREQRLARRIAAVVAGNSKQGVDDPAYKSTLPVLLQGIGHGSLLRAITDLSSQDHPNLALLTREVARLTRDEFDQFVARVRTRIKAIETLKKIVEAVDFKASQNEKTIQRLFETAPWLVDPTYTQFLTADKRASTLFRRLASALEISGESEAADWRRPDLVFLVGNEALQRVVIVELKSANLPLEAKYLGQLEVYIDRAEKWLSEQGRQMTVHGHLIGSMPKPKTLAEGSLQLLARLRKEGPSSPFRVRDYIQVVEETEQAHFEILELSRRLEEGERT